MNFLTLVEDLQYAAIIHAGRSRHECLPYAADLIESLIPAEKVWQTVKPPCTKCGRTGGTWERIDEYTVERKLCPACVDHPGVQPFGEWVMQRIAPKNTIQSTQIFIQQDDPYANGYSAGLRDGYQIGRKP